MLRKANLGVASSERADARTATFSQYMMEMRRM